MGAISQNGMTTFDVVSRIENCQPEMSHDMTKPTKWVCAHRRLRSVCASAQSDQSLLRLIRVFAVRMKKAWVLSYPLSAQRRLWSDWADAQADLSLRWAHSHFVGFVMSRLKYFFYFITTVDTMTLTSHLFDVKNAKTTLLLNDHFWRCFPLRKLSTVDRSTMQK